jgi:hypothetical protein
VLVAARLDQTTQHEASACLPPRARDIQDDAFGNVASVRKFSVGVVCQVRHCILRPRRLAHRSQKSGLHLHGLKARGDEGLRQLGLPATTDTELL